MKRICLRCGEEFKDTCGYAGSVTVYDKTANWRACDCGFAIVHWTDGEVQVNERDENKNWIYKEWKSVPEGCVLVVEK